MTARMTARTSAAYLFAATVLVSRAPDTLRAQTTTARATTARATAAPAPAHEAALQSSGNAVAGHATFTQYCSICHGTHAQGFIGPRIAGIDFGRVGIRTIVRRGLGGYGGMPPFSSDSVSDRHLDDVLAYLVSLGPPPVAASTSSAAAAGPASRVTATPQKTGAHTNAPTSPTKSSPSDLASTTGAASTGDAAHGGALFGANCASCHGAAGQGGFGPTLKNEKNRKGFDAAVAWIENPAPPMPKLYPSPLSEQNVRDVAAFVEKL